MDELTMSLQEGRSWPMGATWDKKNKGINFAVFSSNATAVQLCLFDDAGTQEIQRLPLTAKTNHIWHGYLPHADLGQVYAYRVEGPWQPDAGHRFDSTIHLLDPYAREILGNANDGFKARVVDDDDFDWGGDSPPAIPLNATVLYETHVKGFSKRNPALPALIRGTYAGLAHEQSIKHLQQLGITAVSLLPVHFALDEPRLVKLGLSNYWGYNTLGFFCATPKLGATQNPRNEFRAMVKSLHQAGIEVILDVVFNHTAESDEAGTTLSFRGFDNAAYYRLPETNRAAFENYSGCGNTLDIRQPQVLQLVMDSLRYWVSDMHVDGFRFDLAPVLGRDDEGFKTNATFFQAVAQDPILSRVKMIAEPWDIGPGGYQVGHFPRGWLEWNDHFRDSMRKYWLHDGKPSNTRGDFAMRLCGSSDLYQGRSPSESVNYVVSHDGFTLRDLVSFEDRHNLANGENNRDGHGHNLSINCGIEGETNDQTICALRLRLQRALTVTTLLSLGTPMLCAGDEIGHSQEGNNNPYCQDNETTWIDWSSADQDLLAFTSKVLALRSPLQPLGTDWQAQLLWRRPNGDELQGDAWHDRREPALACLVPCSDQTNYSLLLIFNPEFTEQRFNLPKGQWQLMLDSGEGIVSPAVPSRFEHQIIARPHTCIMLKQNK
jgi:glycogen debranching enzyme GlgX